MKIMVTGGQSMVGKPVCELLKQEGHKVDSVPHDECDLTIERHTNERFEMFEPEAVIHLAGYNGGIAWNKEHPEEIFRRTSLIGLNVLRACDVFKVRRVVSIISSCAYPDMGEKTMKEEDFWSGLPNHTVECHGLSKRMLHAYSRQINKQSPTECICAVVNNSYGPWDSFHPLKTKVVAALIKKFVEAKEIDGVIECWGSGAPRREFIYSKDVAKALSSILLNWKMEWGDLVNVGTGADYSIKELTEKISQISGSTKKCIWDTSKPDGQMKKMLDSSLLKEKLGFRQGYTLEEGLKETIEWYRENKETADARFNL